jgi:beta-lactamase class A
MERLKPPCRTEPVKNRLLLQRIIIAAGTLGMLGALLAASLIFPHDDGSGTADGDGAIPYRLSVPAPPVAITGLFYQAPRTREELLGRLRALVDGTPGDYGIFVRELRTGAAFGINEDTMFQAASTIKVPILMKLYQEISLGAVSREQVMTYLPADFEDGTGSIQGSGFGSQWSVAELADRMMRESDNVAKNMLFRLLGYYEIEAFAADLGTEFDVMNNQTSPQGMANLLRSIYEHDFVDGDLAEEMLDLMTGSIYENRLPRYLGETRVAHKVGTWGGAVSDVGIVFLADNPFVICIYSEGVGDVEAAKDIIGRIALDVYLFEGRAATAPAASN